VEGDLDEDEAPPEGETVQAYVIETNKKGCFVRLARHIEGRATLTELCDGFLQNPEASFPPGRLVVGRIKSISSIPKTKSSKNPAKFKADLDMRETTLLGSKKAISFEDIEINAKYKGTVSRIESYGVFVQLENSKVSGLVHLSECSDGFVKNIASLYDPGDLVKVLVIKKDDDEKKIGFSMKASHFEGDQDSDDDSSVSDAGDGIDDTMEVDEEIQAYSDLDSEDENFTSKLASKIAAEADEHGSDDSESTGNEDESDSEPESEEGGEKLAIDTDVGFDWGFDGMGKPKDNGIDPGSSDDSDSEDEGPGKSASHSSRKKQAQRRREEQEISKRESALADGTADANPETAGDFERLLAGNPNSSELWIRYMAFHLSVADISSARLVAEKAIDRIDFREEREKLNVWTALLTVEHKYGTDSSLRTAIDRACGQNNPKQVYLRACEILEKDLSTAECVVKADAMYHKMCTKFKSKKKVWLAHLTYLLKQSRNEEAHSLLKRALLSLAPHKHAETMCKFAQLEYEFGIPERARTIFDGIVAKYPKRLDLFYIYIDKEIKFGSFATARALLQNKVNGAKLTDKQVKGLFKKWFHLEERHGDEASMEHVKDCARKYVQKTSETN
jgi:rRNA biogenesis protein RRP5